MKQAELFAAVRAEWGIPRDDTRKLREYPTLAHVVRFVYDNRPDLAKPESAAPATFSPAAPAASLGPVPAAVAPSVTAAMAGAGRLRRGSFR